MIVERDMTALRSHVMAVVLALGLGPALSPAQTPSLEEGATTAAGSEDPTPAFESEVEIVTVDVVVVDKEGRAVPGFERSDFSLYEEGEPQAITRFEAVQMPPLPPKEEEVVAQAPVSTNQGAEARQYRTFVIIFDDINLSPAQALRAKAAIGEFLKTGVREGDFVMLVASAGSAWWTARIPEGRDELNAILQRLDGRFIFESSPDRVTPYEAMRIVEYDDAEVGYQVQRRFDAYGTVGRDRVDERQYADTLNTTALVGLIDPYVRSRAADVHRQSTQRRRITMRTMTRALRALSGIRGRKAMILVSQGFVYQPGFNAMRELVEESMRVNVPVHFIDTRGLVALPEAMTAAYATVNVDVQDTVAVLADISREAEGSEAVALDTGGIVIKNTNDLGAGINRVSAESQAFYLLGYYSSNRERDGKFREIEVKLNGQKGKGLKVRARRGYFAPLEGETPPRESEADPVIVHALDSPFEIRTVPLRVSAFVFEQTLANQLNVKLAAEIDVRQLELRRDTDRIRGEVAFLVETQHLESGEYYTVDEKIEMAMLPETFERLQETGYVVSRDFSLPPGTYQAKVVVRDLASGEVGSVIHDFSVPDGEGLRLSTPVISDELEEDLEEEAQTPPRPVLRVRRRFAPGSTLYVQYSVFGAQKDDESFLPRVMAGYEIRRGDGSVFKESPETRISPTSIGALLRLHGIRLRGAEPGDYELILKVRDSLSGRSLEVREPFSIAVGEEARLTAAS
jgi:VWFA-related protein